VDGVYICRQTKNSDIFAFSFLGAPHFLSASRDILHVVAWPYRDTPLSLGPSRGILQGTCINLWGFSGVGLYFEATMWIRAGQADLIISW